MHPLTLCFVRDYLRHKTPMFPRWSTTLSIIGQLSRGRSKGKTFAEALVDDEMEGIEEMVVEAKSVVVGMLRGEEE